MENQDEQALNPIIGEETNVDATPAIEEQTAEEAPIESTEPASTEETKEVETDQRPKKGAEHRIRELSGEVKSLRQKLGEATGRNGAIPTQQFTPQIDLDSGEVSPEQYRQHVMQEASNLVDLKLKQSETLNRIDTESAQVMKEYPQLDPDSDQFDKELSDTISEAIEAQVKLNPYTTSVKKFADRLMKPFTKAVSNAVEQEKEVITRQASESALRPTNIRKQEKPFAEKSIAEMEAELGIQQT